MPELRSHQPTAVGTTSRQKKRAIGGDGGRAGVGSSVTISGEMGSVFCASFSSATGGASTTRLPRGQVRANRHPHYQEAQDRATARRKAKTKGEKPPRFQR